MQGGDEEHDVLSVAKWRLLIKSVRDGDCLIYAPWRKPTKTGHRQMDVRGERDLAHRWAYRAAVGPIPADKQINHHCDRADCVRVEHLYLGTQSENTLDAVRRGRYVKNRGGAKLTWDDVAVIRASSLRTGLLAQQYGVSRYVVQDVRAGRSWVK